MKQIFLNQKELAQFVNLSTRRIQQLKEKGVFKKESNKKYDLAKSVRGYISYLRSQAEGDELKSARLRREIAKANMAEMEAMEKAGSLVRKGESLKLISMLIAEAKQNFRILPRRVSEVLVGRDAKEIELILMHEIDDVLFTLSGTPKPEAKEVFPWERGIFEIKDGKKVLVNRNESDT